MPAICFLLRGKPRQTEVTKEAESPDAGSKSIADSTESLGMVQLNLCLPSRDRPNYQGHQLRALENPVVVIEQIPSVAGGSLPLRDTNLAAAETVRQPLQSKPQVPL